jgi:hypothetical protein
MFQKGRTGALYSELKARRATRENEINATDGAKYRKIFCGTQAGPAAA